MERVVPLGRVRADTAALPAESRARIAALCDALIAPRIPLAGMTFDRPHVMGIVNLTPDSFSDARPPDPVAAARAMIAAGAAIVDLGGESTRPGAVDVPVAEELARVMPVLAALFSSPSGEGRETAQPARWGETQAAVSLRSPPGRGSAASLAPPLKGRGGISIDTRKAAVMAAALDAGAALVNDVSALTFDPAALALVAARGAPVVLMHAQGTPATMQVAPQYDDVVADVFDWLEARIAACLAAGIDRTAIVADPGIGFGKTPAHNAALLRGIATFHGLGVPLLLGASRKAVIPRLTGDGAPVGQRLGGSIALALHGVAHGVQIVRVHDVPETVQAIGLAQAVR